MAVCHCDHRRYSYSVDHAHRSAEPTQLTRVVWLSCICRDVPQAVLQLLGANYHSASLKPIQVLTDLKDKWILMWLDRVTVRSFHASRAVALGLIQDFLTKVILTCIS